MLSLSPITHTQSHTIIIMDKYLNRPMFCCWNPLWAPWTLQTQTILLTSLSFAWSDPFMLFLTLSPMYSADLNLPPLQKAKNPKDISIVLNVLAVYPNDKVDQSTIFVTYGVCIDA